MSQPPEPLRGPDLSAASRLAEAAGLAGIYVANALAGGTDVDVLGFRDPDGGLRTIAWFGKRGNLMVLDGDSDQARGLDPSEVAAGVLRHRAPWRIVLGPADVVAALAQREVQRPLVDRWQVHYGIERGDPVPATAADVRLAVSRDARALVRAALDLNASDLNVAAWRVHRGWLRDSVRRRIREGRTWVVGPEGAPVSKVDVGSRGPAGAVLEGVHTRADSRGLGLATALVARVAAELLADVPRVSLHVAEANVAARRAYERAGMVARARCRLMLRS